ncbi:ADP-ribosyl-(dinitrogen reductase) hydrolase [Cupriavidus basilensis]
MSVVIPPRIKTKLADVNHQVSEEEVREAFDNICGSFLVDSREDHQTDPPTLWFVAETRKGRFLKVMFVPREGNNIVKSAYEATENIQRIYDKFAK